MFSRKTILEVVNAINFRTHDEIERFSIEFNLDGLIDGVSIKQKETSITKYLIANENIKGPSGSVLVVEVIEYILREKSNNGFNMGGLENSLEKDGYELTNKTVRKSLPIEIPLVENENRLVDILKKRGFSVSLGHYEQAIATHGRGEWAAANSQLRSFVESFFNEVYGTINTGNACDSQAKKIELAKQGFFYKDYNEFLCNGTGFIEGFWKRLHPHGSHPGLSEAADSTFRLHLVLLVIHHFAERLDFGLDLNNKTQ